MNQMRCKAYKEDQAARNMAIGILQPLVRSGTHFVPGAHVLLCPQNMDRPRIFVMVSGKRWAFGLPLCYDHGTHQSLEQVSMVMPGEMSTATHGLPVS